MMHVRILPAALMLAVLPGCEVTDPSLGTVSLRLGAGDAALPVAMATPVEASDIAAAQVWISRAYLVPAGEDGEFVTLVEEQQEYDLLNLQDGATALLGSATVTEGDYAQLRLVVDSARITLVEGASFADGESSQTVFVPSGAQTGIKVGFAGPLSLGDGTVVVVTFVVSDNFVFLGPPPAPLGVLFTPLLVGTVMEG